MSEDDKQDKTRVQPPTEKPGEAGSPEKGASDATPDNTETQLQFAVDDEFEQGDNLDVTITEISPSGAGLLKDRFVLERVLGAGGMGIVYKAKDLLKVEARDRDPYVAIKVLGDELKAHPEAFIALQRESRKTQRIAHPNIVNVHDFDKDGDMVFMTMEYLEGTPLDKVLKRVRDSGLPRTEAFKILKDICAALSYAHEQHLIHSDLKPGNIFVTDTGLVKVFDFGIARAVAKVEQGDITQVEDKTLFDAGNFGALTPAYASLEMIEGDPADVRDDIFALGCIAYELLTGAHPFKRKNAKQALRRGLKPERIKGITKRQWRAIEGALALERENRLGSVTEFWAQLSTQSSGKIKLWAVALVVGVSVGFAAWSQLSNYNVKPQQPSPSEEDYRNKFGVEAAQKKLDKLLTSLSFDPLWEASLWQEVQTLGDLLGDDNPQVLAVQAKAHSEYLKKIKEAIDADNLSAAKAWVTSATRYTLKPTELNALDNIIEKKRLEQKRSEQAKLEQQAKRQALAAEQAAREAARSKVNSTKRFKEAMAGINKQLECNQLLDMPVFETTIGELKALDASRYKKLELNITHRLADCIARITRNFPEQGLRAQRSAQNLFPGNSLFKGNKVVTYKKGACKPSFAGIGSRGRRSRCQDKLASGVKGPLTVVIPASDTIPLFTIGRYEVTVAQYNQYCLATNACGILAEKNTALPVTGISYNNVRAYLAWLSEQSGEVYRLPTYQEWGYAAKAERGHLDSNRNCTLNTRGIKRGGTLVKANIGQQNSWGLVNHVGNAAEWVTQGQQLLSVGASYNTKMPECNLSTKHSSKGEANTETGFRVVRLLSN